MNIKELILAALQTKFTGVDAAILSRIAEKKAVGVTDETQVTSIVEGVGFSDVLNSYGDFRANGAVTSAISNYEQKYNIKDGKPIENPNPNPNPQPAPQDNISDIVKAAVAEAVKPYAEKLTQFEGEKAAQERMAQVLAKAKEYGISDAEAKRYAIPNDADLDSYFKDVKQEKINEGTYINPESPEQQMKTNEQELVDLIGKC